MSVMKEDGTKRLIDQILASLKVGKIAIMDKVLNINSSNPVENKVITQAINGINSRLDDEFVKNGDIIEFTNTASVNSNETHTFNFSYALTDNGYTDAIILDYFQTEEQSSQSNYVDAHVGGYFAKSGTDETLIYPSLMKRVYTQLVTEKKTLGLYLNVYNEHTTAMTMTGTIRVLLLK